MSCYMPINGALFGIVTGTMVGIYTHWAVGIIVGIVLGVVGFAAWIYSPLPDSNGGWGHPPAKRQKWGWTDEPATEYEDPDEQDLMQCALPGITAGLSGINWATPKEDSDD